MNKRKAPRPLPLDPLEPLSKEQVEEVVEVPAEQPENKYQPKPKVGTPNIGVPTGKVTSVGLGKLNVTTNGTRNYL